MRELGGILDTPVLGGDYVVAAGADGVLRAFDRATGTAVWTRRVANALGWNAVIGHAEMLIVCVGGQGTGIAAIDFGNAEVLWSARRAARRLGCVADKRLVAQDWGEKLVCLDVTNGSLMWETEPLERPLWHAGPACTRRAAAALGYEHIYVYRMPDGQALRTLEAGGMFTAPHLVWVSEEELLIGITNAGACPCAACQGDLREVDVERESVLGDNRVVRISVATGHRVWEARIEGNARRLAVLDDKAYVGDTQGRLYQLNVGDGLQRWALRISAKASIAGVCPASDVVYVTATDGAVGAVDARTGSVLWTTSLPGSIKSAPACDAQHLFVGTLDGVLYCLALDGDMRWQVSAKDAQN
jgi:outer membrane protein assembly factor BamB